MLHYEHIRGQYRRTFSDSPRSPTCVFRTVGHDIALEKVQWVEGIEETQSLNVTEGMVGVLVNVGDSGDKYVLERTHDFHSL